MSELEERIYKDAFRLWGLKPTAPSKSYGPSGSVYACDNDVAHGEYWVHFHENLFAVNAYEMFFGKPCVMRYEHAEHMSVCLYEDATNMIADGYKVEPGTVSVYLGEDGQEFVGRYSAEAHVKATSITITPDYYRDYLRKRFGTVPDVRPAFAKMDGRRDFPELTSLLRRIREYHGDGIAADLFYEGAVAEAMGLVMKRAADIDTAGAETMLTRVDVDALSQLEAYVTRHLDETLTVEQMARRCCMGLTKFKAAFKNSYGCTPAQYVHRARMSRAKELLEKTDDSVAAVAAQVGYRKASAFCAAFKRSEGVLPGHYHDRMRRERLA